MCLRTSHFGSGDFLLVVVRSHIPISRAVSLRPTMLRSQQSGMLCNLARERLCVPEVLLILTPDMGWGCRRVAPLLRDLSGRKLMQTWANFVRPAWLDGKVAKLRMRASFRGVCSQLQTSVMPKKATGKDRVRRLDE